jgi:2-pyrone-4,6-dicarboxylate lactonase
VTGVDVHAHVLAAPERPVEGVAYQPFAAPVSEFLAHLDGLGLARGVLVNPSTYRRDHTVLLDALRAHPDRLRGVAVLSSTVDDAVLDEMHEAGVRGCRIQDRMSGGLAIDELPALLTRIAERGWHVEVWTDLTEHLPVVRSAVECAQAPILLDHLGIQPGSDVERGTAIVRELLGAGPCWVTLSGAYRVLPGLTEAEAARMLRPTVDALLDTAPDRLVWGSDWPYVVPPGPRPTAADHAAVLEAWLPDDEIRERVLRTNPAVLYGWS